MLNSPRLLSQWLLGCSLVLGSASGLAYRDISNAIPPLSGSSMTLAATPADSVVVLDYGADIEGFSTFEVLDAGARGSTLEITYSETAADLETYYMVSKFELHSTTMKTCANQGFCRRAMGRTAWLRPWIRTVSLESCSTGPRTTRIA
jgi:hypothetical protein